MKRDLKAILGEINNGKKPTFLLLHGDDYQVNSASRALLDLLVPSEKRAFNLEQFDGRTTAWEEIELALMTPPFFSGTKAVFIENAPYFLSREQKGELGVKVVQFWGEGKKDEAARLFLDLLLLEGWNQERWERLRDSPSVAHLSDIFGADDRGMSEELQGIVAFCRNSAMDLSQHRAGEGHRLVELLEQGLPPWAVLLIAASQVDRRSRLYKRFDEQGFVLDLGLARDRSGRVRRETLAEFLDKRLKEVGKNMDGSAREIVLARAGTELWAIHQELEKLFLYVGEEPRIKAKDVEEAYLDQGEGWVFDLLKTIADRQPLQALGHLARLLSQGDHPLKLLGTIVSEVRRLLAARQLIDGEMGGKWKRNMTYAQFQQNVLQDGAPLLSQNPYRDYMIFKNAENFTTRELLRSMKWIYQTDQRLKSSGSPPRMAMERLILEMCQKE